MKKVLAICLMVMMLASMSVSAFAAPGGFVASPSGNPAPSIISFDASDEGCTAQLVITPYSKRDQLSADLKTLIEKAYGEVVASDDLTKLNADLAKLAKDKEIKGTDLAVSDLFDVNVTGCANHDGHVGFDVTLKADTLKNFVGLLYMTEDGKWELVSDAEVVNNGEHLKFSVDSLCPFAIVVDTDGLEMPDTGDNGMIYVYAAIMAISALAILVLVIKHKKQRV